MIYRNIMDCLRRYVRRVEDSNEHTRAQIEAIENTKGSPYYAQRVPELEAEGEKKRVQLFENTKTELIKYLDTMRANCKARLSKAPTLEQIGLLNLLSNLDDLSIRDFELFAPQMKESPVAMRSFNQMAKEHNLRIIIPDPVDTLAAVDIVEGYLAQFLSNFRGDTEHSTSSIERELYTALMHDDTTAANTPYRTLNNLDRAAWDDFILSGMPVSVEDFESGTPAPRVQYFFKDVDSLRKYISTQTSNLEGADATKKENEILSKCPEQYASSLRYFRATGEKLPINDPSV